MKYELWGVLNECKSNALAEYLLRNGKSCEFTEANLTSAGMLASVYEYFGHKTPEDYVESTPEYDFQFITDVDLRIDYLTLSGFRGVPVPFKMPGGRPGINAFGISFAQPARKHFFSKTYPRFLSSDHYDKACVSLVLLGNNGSGKTSIYSAIELLCTGSTSIERKHVIEKANLSRFRNHIHNGEEKFQIGLKVKDSGWANLTLSEVANDKDKNKKTVRKVEKSDNLIKLNNGLDLSLFFCSESDLAIYECSGKSIANYVDEVCGLGEIDAVIALCDRLIHYVENHSDKAAELSDEAKNEVPQLAAILINRLRDEKDKIQEKVLGQAQRILQRLLGDFLDENVELSYNRKNDLKIFDGNLKVKTKEERINPREYFNNFRFKMYLVSLRIGMAFYIMRSRGVRFPLIFDDIFDSSDFPNRVSTKKFFQKIMEIYASENISDSLLQIIFFTQDEIIAESVYSGIYQEKNEWTETPRRVASENGSVVLGRIFPADYWRDQDKKCGYDKINGDVHWFINLYDPIKQHQYQMCYEKT